MAEKKVDALSYEEAYEELEGIVAALEAGEHKLDEALGLYERGQALAARCGLLLDEAELKVQQLSANGELTDFE
jgi:exodeoxyribonuclease VII small subunit